ncbi:hypothetical protein [Nibrella saemangeumensis]
MAHQHTQSAGTTATTLIDETIKAFDPGANAATPQEGLSLINDWFSSLKTQPLAEDMVDIMRELREELQGGMPDNKRLRSLLESLADQTDKIAPQTGGDYPSRLTSLSTALRNFAGQLSTTV